MPRRNHRWVLPFILQTLFVLGLACAISHKAKGQAPVRPDSTARPKADTICAQVLDVTDTKDKKGQIIRLRITSGDTVRYGWVKTERAPIFVSGTYDFILGPQDSLVRRGERKKTCLQQQASAGGSTIRRPFS